jgi:hypothetical protein
MEQITTVGIDLAKNVFQVHAIDGKIDVSGDTQDLSISRLL